MNKASKPFLRSKSNYLWRVSLFLQLGTFLQFAITLYQWFARVIIDPLLYSAFGYVSRCKYEESCSVYAKRQLREHATIPALRKIWRRVWSCHSF